jgi:hypothetical protein
VRLCIHFPWHESLDLIFLQFSSDSDDIFGDAPQRPRTGSTKRRSSGAALFTDDDDGEREIIPNAKTIAPKPVDSLFGDDGSSDDDIFGGGNKRKAKPKSTKADFSDGEDGND